MGAIKRVDNKAIMAAARTTLAATDAAKRCGVSRDTICSVRAILANGTPEEIAAAEVEGASISRIANGVRARGHRPTFKGPRLTGRSEAERAAVEKTIIYGRIAKNFRNGLDLLGTMPAIPEVIEALRKDTRRHNRAPLKIAEAIKFLEDFAYAYSRNDHAAVTERKNGTRNAHAGIRGAATGVQQIK